MYHEGIAGWSSPLSNCISNVATRRACSIVLDHLLVLQTKAVIRDILDLRIQTKDKYFDHEAECHARRIRTICH
jgi:hypothetical protein